MNGRKSRLGAALVYTTVAVLQRGFAFLILPFVTRVMPPSEYGVVAILAASGGLMAALVGAPLELSIFRDRVKNRQGSPVQCLSYLYLYAALPTVLSLVALAVLASDRELFSVAPYLWCVQLPATAFNVSVTVYAMSILRADDRLKAYSALGLSSVLLMGILKICLLSMMDNKALAWTLSDLVSAVVLAAITAAWLFPPTMTSTPGGVRALLREALPQVPHRVSFWAIASLSRPAMSLFLPLSAVGAYALAGNIASVAGLLLIEFTRSLLVSYVQETFPAPTSITRLHARTQLMAALALPGLAAAGLVFVGPAIIGEAYGESYRLTAILLIGQCLYGIYLVPTSYILHAGGRTDLGWQSSASGALFLFVGLLAVGTLYPHAEAVAAASAASYALMALVAVVILKRSSLSVAVRDVLPRPWPSMFAVIGLALSSSSLMLRGKGEIEWIDSLLAACGIVSVAVSVAMHFSVERSLPAPGAAESEAGAEDR